jgi:hypothetical protein
MDEPQVNKYGEFFCGSMDPLDADFGSTPLKRSLTLSNVSNTKRFSLLLVNFMMPWGLGVEFESFSARKLLIHVEGVLDRISLLAHPQGYHGHQEEGIPQSHSRQL